MYKISVLSKSNVINIFMASYAKFLPNATESIDRLTPDSRQTPQ
jgi:hypothetical protein